MQLNERLISLLSYGAVTLGIALGAIGIVRGGSLFIALGTAGIALKSRNFRTLEFYIPLAIAIALFVVAIALPRGR
jgi:hypothetical protein